MPTEVVLTASVLNTVCQHAREQPNREACGILLGAWGTPIIIDTVVPGVNMLDAPDRYMLDAASLLAADAAASAQGASIVGFYHSHPNHHPIPSGSDRRAAWPGFIYLIVGTRDEGALPTCAWSIDPELSIHPVLIRAKRMGPSNSR